MRYTDVITTAARRNGFVWRFVWSLIRPFFLLWLIVPSYVVPRIVAYSWKGWGVSISNAMLLYNIHIMISEICILSILGGWNHLWISYARPVQSWWSPGRWRDPTSIKPLTYEEYRKQTRALEAGQVIPTEVAKISGLPTNTTVAEFRKSRDLPPSQFPTLLRITRETKAIHYALENRDLNSLIRLFVRLPKRVRPDKYAGADCSPLGPHVAVTEYNRTRTALLERILTGIESMESDSTRKEAVGTIRAYANGKGRAALGLSGGGSLSVAHFGVLATLREENLLPTVISGSSGGACIAAILGTTSPEEYERIIPTEQDESTEFVIAIKIFQALLPRLSVQMVNKINGNTALDVVQVAKAMRSLCGDMTFKEAYDKTGIEMVITMTREQTCDGLVCSRVTTPNVIIWSAVLASSCLPVLLPPVYVLQKLPIDQAPISSDVPFPVNIRESLHSTGNRQIRVRHALEGSEGQPESYFNNDFEEYFRSLLLGESPNHSSCGLSMLAPYCACDAIQEDENTQQRILLSGEDDVLMTRSSSNLPKRRSQSVSPSSDGLCYIIERFGGDKYCDGSIVQDIPIGELTRLHGVGFTITSQVNPHHSPSIRTAPKTLLQDNMEPMNWTEPIWAFLELDLKLRYIFTTEKLYQPVIDKQPIGKFYGVLNMGDVAITPCRRRHFYRMALCPTSKTIRDSYALSKQRTYPFLAQIRERMEEEKRLDRFFEENE